VGAEKGRARTGGRGGEGGGWFFLGRVTLTNEMEFFFVFSSAPTNEMERFVCRLFPSLAPSLSFSLSLSLYLLSISLSSPSLSLSFLFLASTARPRSDEPLALRTQPNIASGG
jgi:hypothetical protein